MDNAYMEKQAPPFMFPRLKRQLLDSDEFVWMSRDVGVPIDRGVVAGGGLYTGQLFSIGVFDYYCDDVLNIAYGEAKTKFNFTDQLGLLAAIQYTDQRSVGDNLLNGTSFSTNQFGAYGMSISWGNTSHF